MTLLKKQTYTGSCLCESIKFQFINEKIKTIYRCYCSLCRRQSGTSSNASLLISSRQFQWLQGQEFVEIFLKETGFNSHFCKKCGSPVPNPLSKLGGVMWIPLGLINEDFSIEHELAFCITSQTSWAKQLSKISIQQYDELPSWAKLNELFNLDEK